MKILMVLPLRGGAVDNLMAPLAKPFADLGHETIYHYLAESQELPKVDYDVAYLGYFHHSPSIDQITSPFIAGVHHLTADKLAYYSQFLLTEGPDHIITNDRFVVRQLGQNHIFNVTYIPQAFDHSPFKAMTLPPEFTIGYIGCHGAEKRLATIEMAASLLKIPVHKIVHADKAVEKDHVPFKEILDFYSRISCYVVASFDEGGPLPAQEALLCGRPVITTHVGMMEDLITDEYNGLFFDGSPRDLVRALQQIQPDLRNYAANAVNTVFYELEDVVPEYLKVFEKVLA